MSRYKEYYILKYGDKYISYAGYNGSGREFVHFKLTDKERDADKFWKGSLHDMKIVVELMRQEIGIVGEIRAKYIADVVL